MKDKLTDLFLFGMGTASLAKDLVEDFVDEMIQSGQACSESRTQMVRELSEKAALKKDEYEKRFQEMRQTLAKELKPAMQNDLQEVLQIVKSMDKRLSLLEKRLDARAKQAHKEKKLRQKL